MIAVAIEFMSSETTEYYCIRLPKLNHRGPEGRGRVLSIRASGIHSPSTRSRGAGSVTQHADAPAMLSTWRRRLRAVTLRVPKARCSASSAGRNQTAAAGA